MLVDGRIRTRIRIHIHIHIRTNNDGFESGSWRPKNFQILWIRIQIRNTASLFCWYAHVGLTRVGSCTKNLLCTYDLYRPVHNAFDAGSIQLLGQVGGGWALEIESFLVLGNGIEPIVECHLGPKKLEIIGAKIVKILPSPHCHLFGMRWFPRRPLKVAALLSRGETRFSVWCTLRQQTRGASLLQSILDVERRMVARPAHRHHH